MKLSKQSIKDMKDIARREQFSDRRRISNFKIRKQVRDWVYVSFISGGYTIREIYGNYGDCWRYIMLTSERKIKKNI